MNILAFDMDDTLLHDDLSVSSYTIDVLHRLHDKEWLIIPASGRARESIRPFIEKIGVVDYYITCNGAQIWNASEQKLLKRETFTTQIGKEIARFGKEHHCYSQTYEGDSFFFNEQSEWAVRYACSSMLKGQYVGDLEEFINEPRSKILMMAEESKIVFMLRQARLQFGSRVSVTCSKPYFLEFNPLSATKGNALQYLCTELNKNLYDIISFGDSLNDLSMLTSCGKGVAMQNSQPSVLEICHEKCLSNNEDGVARYMQQHYLKEQVLL